MNILPLQASETEWVEVKSRIELIANRKNVQAAWETITQAVKTILEGTGVPLIINDRVDVALAVDAEIYRLHDDGKIPSDNPFVNQKGAKPAVWSYGHRNPQGMCFLISSTLA